MERIRFVNLVQPGSSSLVVVELPKARSIDRVQEGLGEGLYFDGFACTQLVEKFIVGLDGKETGIEVCLQQIGDFPPGEFFAASDVQELETGVVGQVGIQVVGVDGRMGDDQALQVGELGFDDVKNTVVDWEAADVQVTQVGGLEMLEGVQEIDVSQWADDVGVDLEIEPLQGVVGDGWVVD